MPRPPQRTEDFSGSYGPDPAAIYDARRDFSRWLDASVDDGDILDEMLVVLSELMANAVAATEDPSGDVTVAAWVDADGLTLKVTNPPASTFAAVNRWDYDDPLRAGGRGLLIVESLVDDLAIAPPNGPEPLSVRARKELRSDH
jgi:anti-sigma regulatory factor (Ser/Thr protein kinase)